MHKFGKKEAMSSREREQGDDLVETNTETREYQAATEEVLNEFQNRQNDDRTTSCANCSKEVRVEHVTSFKRGQHISMPGRSQPACLPKHLYKHHAIVKEIVRSAGTRVEMKLIHFSNEEGNKSWKPKVCEQTKTFDLKHDEICIIEYKHTRYSAEEIIHGAEFQMRKNDQETQEFSSYNPITSNCEHFSTWCVVGYGVSLQVQRLFQFITEECIPLLGVVGRILVKLLSKVPLLLKYMSLIDGAYLILLSCTVTTIMHLIDYFRKKMCWSCLKRQLQDLFLTIGTLKLKSFMTVVITRLHRTPPDEISFDLFIELLSKMLDMILTKILQAIQFPFVAEKLTVQTLTELLPGDVVLVKYYWFEHAMIVSEVEVEANQPTAGRIRGIHYGLQNSYKTPEITEEYFALNLTKDKVKKYDFQAIRCRLPDDVIKFARKRVGEKKWNLMSNRSDNFCFWAKHLVQPSGICEKWANGNLAESETKRLSSTFIEKKEVHLISDIQIGDVVEFRNIGIVVGIENTDCKSERRCQIETIVYDKQWLVWYDWYVRRRSYEVDLNINRVFVWKYHPAHCHPMDVRARRAKDMEDKVGLWWTNQGFIEHCILLKP